MTVFLIGVTAGIGSVPAPRLHGARAEPAAAHLFIEVTIFNASDEAVQLFAPVNAVVNCAGSLCLKPARLPPDREWRGSSDLGVTTAFSTAAAATDGPRHLHVNCVAPCLVWTPPVNRMTPNETALRASQGMPVPGRIRTPDDVASALAFPGGPAVWAV